MTTLPQVSGRRVIILLHLSFLMVFIAIAWTPAQAQVGEPSLVIQANIEGSITRATVEFFKETLTVARDRGAEAIVLKLNTPGGGVAETEEIVELMLNSPVPFIGYVGPTGASADSAGTWILMATDLAAMAPGTTIGSLQPVIIGPEGFQPITDEKIVNNIVAKVKNVLSLHGRNESLAEAFVKENLNLNAEDAFAVGATEAIASSVEDLLAKVNGAVTPYKGIRLSLSSPTIELYETSLRLRALVIISDPTVASILFLLGIYGIIFGISTPGHGAEIFGVIAIALGLIGLGFGISLVALFLLVLGIALLIVEIATPSFGVVGTGGIIAIILGSIFLAPISPPNFLIAPAAQLQILLALLVPTGVVGGFLLFALYKVLQVRRQKPYHLRLIGGRAVAVDPLGPAKRGHVRYDSELWQAVSDEEIQPEETVFIRGREGPVLSVSKMPPPPPEEGESPEHPFRRLVAALKRINVAWRRTGQDEFEEKGEGRT